MKRLIAIFLSLVLILTGCVQPEKNPADTESDVLEESIKKWGEWKEIQQEYNSLSDANLLAYVEDLVYKETVNSLNDAGYFVENVSAIYISKEYIEELEYNSQANIYFGNTLAELDAMFQGARYVFTLGEDGQTTVQELEVIENNNIETMLKNVMIGTGVILICVTVSTVTAGAGAPAVSMIFTASAKTGTFMALSSGGFGAISAGIIRGIQIGDMEEAMEAAALTGSENFKWGAISGAVIGGISETIKYAKAMKVLKGADLTGITMQQAASIQMKSGYPVDVIKQFTNMEQYNICENAGLSSQMVNGRTALVRKIDLNYVDEMGHTNLQRMELGLAALDDTGTPYELHHIGQKADSTLAILTKAEHMKGGNNKIWHELGKGKASEVHIAANNWDTQKQIFWKAVASSMGGV